MKCFLGLDGGGTKTVCAILNEEGAVIARGRGPASNPTRIGFPASFAALEETIGAAMRSTQLSLDVAALCAGLAGTGRPENRQQMLEFLTEKFSAARVEVITDLELPLHAMPPGAALVLVVGTGSAAIGRDQSGTVHREGGHGPSGSDEGSAFSIGRSAIAAVRTEPESANNNVVDLARQILRHLGSANWSELDAKATTNADAVFPRVFPVVAAAADAGNALAQSLLETAAEQLANLVNNLAATLVLGALKFPLGKTGGVIGRSRFFDNALDQAILRRLPNAQIRKLSIEPAEIAAYLALRLAIKKEGITR